MQSTRKSTPLQIKQNQSIQKHSPSKISLDLKCLDRESFSLKKERKSIINFSTQTEISKQIDESKIIKRLEVKLNDCEFQLKKANQDFAQFKVLTRMQKEKQIRRYREAYQEINAKLLEQNNLWEIKLLQRQSQYEKKLQQIMKLNEYTKQSEITIAIQKNKVQTQQKIVNIVKSHEEKLKRISSEKQTLLAKTQFKIVEIVNQKQSQKNQLIQKYEQIIEKKIKEKQQQIQFINAKNKCLNAQHQELQQIFTSTKNKHYSDIYQLRLEKNSLLTQIQELKLNFSKASDKIIKQQQDILNLQFQYKELQRQNQVQQNIKTKQLTQLNDKKTQQIFSFYKEVIEEKEKKIEQIQKLQKEVVTFWEKGYEEMVKNFNERSSKIEDIQKIKCLQFQILKKDQENKSIMEQLKKCRLQQQNNEKNYNKIFSSQRKYVEKKQYEPRDPFVRYSNTLDIKSLLKIKQK